MFTLRDTGNWSGKVVAEAETLQAARRAAEVLILEDEDYETLYIHAPAPDEHTPPPWLETATRMEGDQRDRIHWTTSDLSRKYDGRSSR